MVYHKDIGFPSSLLIPDGKIVNLHYSKHAVERFEGKYRKQLILPSFIRITNNNLIEISTNDNINCEKIMVRTTYDHFKDICLVVCPNTGKVITLWINNKNDQFFITNKEKYNTP